MKSILLATASALVGLAAAQSNVNCVSGAHVIVARASGEDPGFGILVSVKDDILDQIPNSDAVAVPYPATIDDPIYFESQPDGVGNMTQLVKEYGDACPDNKMVLLGYSQGAHVVGDVLLGSVNTLFEETSALADQYLSQISSAILMGDPTHVANLSINVGNATHDGVFPRRNNDWASKNLVDRVRSYCDANDTYCDNGNSSEVHAGYVGGYGDRAVEFVVQRFMAENTTDGGTTPTSSGTPGPASPTETGAAVRLGGVRGSATIAVLAVGFAVAL